jgi:aminotransferase in exopolysaccharide biosynthesis
MFESLLKFIRKQFPGEGLVPLHAPIFGGNEQEYVADAVASTFVSSVGAYVNRFEAEVAAYTGSPRAVATVNGTAALHVALQLAGAGRGDLVITQPLTFVATCNAIHYCGAEPVFVDVDRHTLGLSPSALDEFLEINAYLDADGVCRMRADERIIRACVPMHTFGHPADLDGLVAVCSQWNVVLIEDAAESLGSFYKGRHTGTYGRLAALSFNGNKIITTGGGGMVLADEALGSQAKHLTTTAKKPHPYAYEHDEIGYNYRMPNLNAALGCAQFESLELMIEAKRELAKRYAEFFDGGKLEFVLEPENCRSNYWLNAVICADSGQRDSLLATTNSAGVMTRPIWTMMNRLPMYSQCHCGKLETGEWLEARVVNLPSSVLPEMYR